MGDAQLELGDYEDAFASFDRMMQLRPGPAAYARISYAREIRGDLAGALTAMQLAYAATPPHDPEALAAEQVAALRHDIVTDHALAWAYFKVGRIDDARKATERAFRTGSRDANLLSHAAAIRSAIAHVAWSRAS